MGRLGKKRGASSGQAMWFDVQKAVATIAGGEMPAATLTAATIATTATKPGPNRPRVATVAIVAAPPARNPTAEQEADAATLAELLADFGPTSCGAAATTLGWGATRAWQAEARLRASGRVRCDALGRATLIDGPGLSLDGPPNIAGLGD